MNSPPRRRWYQFSRAQVLISTTCFVAATIGAILGAIVLDSMHSGGALGGLMNVIIFLVFCCPLFFTGLGAGIGTLCKRFWWGLGVGIILSCLPLAYVAYVTFLVSHR